MKISINEVYQKAREHHQAGRLVEAGRLYRLLIRQSPDFPPAYYGLAVIMENSSPHLAGRLYARFLALLPEEPPMASARELANRRLNTLQPISPSE